MTRFTLGVLCATAALVALAAWSGAAAGRAQRWKAAWVRRRATAAWSREWERNERATAG